MKHEYFMCVFDWIVLMMRIWFDFLTWEKKRKFFPKINVFFSILKASMEQLTLTPLIYLFIISFLFSFFSPSSNKWLILIYFNFKKMNNSRME